MKKDFFKELQLRCELLKLFQVGYFLEEKREKEQTVSMNKKQLMEKLRKKIGDCTLCDLSKSRNKIVFGTGNLDAKIMFIGEAPGEDEDLKGEPFVGKAGQLLTDIITKGMKIKREDVYIANIVKCRPPHNRTPKPFEALTCLPFLKAQISIIKPEIIVCLGKVAVTYLLNIHEPINQVRGKWFDYQGIKVMATFHPSYLLRYPAAKVHVWKDIKEVMKEAKLPI